MTAGQFYVYLSFVTVRGCDPVYRTEMLPARLSVDPNLHAARNIFL